MDLLNKFKEIYQTSESPRVFFAPGRINLIGEHIDYNGGHVFPATISYGTYALAVKRKDSKIRFHSINMPDKGIIEKDLTDLSYDEKDHWSNYPKGIIFLLQEAGYEINFGLDLLFFGNLPYGAGLSSSASIEMVTGILFKEIYSLAISKLDLIKLAQRVENDYIGVNSGIMDQFSVGLGKKDQAILLNTNTLHYEYAPIKLKNHSILIMNTNKKRALAGSKYNERFHECTKALKELQTKLPISHLCDLTLDEFHKNKHLLSTDTLRKRVRHLVSENERTLRAFHLLRKEDWEAFGRLMTESHYSLQKDYEVTGIELDTIVKAALDQEGVLGARMTGAGFGGCAIALVKNNYMEEIIEKVQALYEEEIGERADFYQTTVVDGAKEVGLDSLQILG